MTRIPSGVLVALVVAGCQGGGEPPSAANASGPDVAAAAAPAPPVQPGSAQPGPLPPGPATPRAQIRAGFGGLVDTIEVSAIEPWPLREAVLIAPDGTSVPATYINVSDNPSVATGTWSLSNRWGETTGPDNALAALALPNMQAGAALRSNEQLLAMVSRADIPLPDPVAYRRDWRNWRIRLGFGTPPQELQTFEIPAPEPPPG